jgi:hypothetical protein
LSLGNFGEPCVFGRTLLVRPLYFWPPGFTATPNF